jgi:hypothetical protein
MPLRLRDSLTFKNFNMPVSYRVNAQGKMRDARNVCSIQDFLRTRNGVQRYNGTALGTSSVVSVSYFKTTADSSKVIAKSGTKLYSVAKTGASTEIKTGLTAGVKHRSVTFNGKSIIALGADGLFSWDGTTFTQLGQASPSTATVATGTGSLTDSTYKVGITFYSSTTGFESNASDSSAIATVSQGIDVSDIPATAANDHIDKVRIYLRDDTANGSYLFITEINLGTTTYTIAADATSTQVPPTINAAPKSGGAKYLTTFGKRVVYSGNSTFPNEVFISNEYLQDAFDDTITQKVIKASGQGSVTGIGSGFYNNDNMNAYLCIFTRSSIEVYSELGGSPSLAKISTDVGCVSHDTIKEINGDIHFMSSNGWHIISNGKLLTKGKKAFKLGEGDIDNIFNDSGYVYELNKSNFDNFFSVYYPTLNQYLTFVSEGSSLTISKAHNYEMEIGGFRPYDFSLGFNAACLAEDANKEEVVLIAGDTGRIYEHSINVTRHDVDASNTSIAIDAFALLYWLSHPDLDASLNFGTLALKALSNSNALTVKCFLNYELDSPAAKSYDFSVAETGFILDVSLLDEGILGDGRTIVRDLSGGIYTTAQSLLIGFYQSIIDSDIGLISGQVDASKNGNSNYK